VAEPKAGARSAQSAQRAEESLLERRRKLLRLHYDDKISAELFAEQEAELTRLLAQVRSENDLASDEHSTANELSAQFDHVASLLAAMDLRRLWDRQPSRATAALGRARRLRHRPA
jgi:hypothetical protein